MNQPPKFVLIGDVKRPIRLESQKREIELDLLIWGNSFILKEKTLEEKKV
jgi:hypothetical protein